MSIKINRKNDMTPFDMGKKPRSQSALLMPLIWGGSYIMTRRFGLKIDRSPIKKLAPPYIVLSTHQGFADYYILPLALFPHGANYVSDVEGFAAYGEKLYRAVGCIGKRRYAPDTAVLKNIQYALEKERIVVLFPEARHSNAGTNSLIPSNMGRLCKLLNVPVVTVSVHGSYLAAPFWDEEHTRDAEIEAEIEILCDRDKIKSISAHELQAEIEKKLTYNEYIWQKTRRMEIHYPRSAEGLHKVLYRCPKCGGENTMASRGDRLFCTKCGNGYIMSTLGELHSDSGCITSVPEWYESQRRETEKQILGGIYMADFVVSVKALPNAAGFIDMGKGRLRQDKNGFFLSLPTGEYKFSVKTMPSVQTEYNYKGTGECIVLSDRNCCYYVYSGDSSFNPTKIQFAAEFFHRQYLQNKNAILK